MKTVIIIAAIRKKHFDGKFFELDACAKCDYALQADGFANIHGPTIWKLLKAGDSYRSIAKSFNEMGVPSARAKPGKKNNWYASTIKNIANRYSVMGDKDDR